MDEPGLRPLVIAFAFGVCFGLALLGLIISMGAPAS